MRWCDDDDPPGHGGMGRGTIVGQSFFDYGINRRLLGDLHRYVKVFTPTNASGNTDFTENFHATMLADNEGRLTLGTYDDDLDTSLTDYGVFEDEIYQVALDGSQRFRRLAHTRSNWRSNGQAGWDDALNGYQATPQPDVTGRLFRPFGPVNLDAEGSLDWTHWGHTAGSPFNRKSGVTAQLSNFTNVGSATPVRYDDNPHSYRWTAGTPTASATDTYTGVAVSGANNGFQLTVPADTNTRTLRLYVGATQARGRIEATLNGSAGPAYSDVSVGGPGGRSDGVYAINYRAQNAGQTLTVRYRDYGGGSVSLQTAGGGFNTSMSVGAISLTQPLAPGASVDVQLLLGVEQTGTFRIYFIVEALP